MRPYTRACRKLLKLGQREVDAATRRIAYALAVLQVCAASVTFSDTEDVLYVSGSLCSSRWLRDKNKLESGAY